VAFSDVPNPAGIEHEEKLQKNLQNKLGRTVSG